MSKLNRDLQRSILNSLAEIYPKLAAIRPQADQTHDEVTANLYYLWQHGLVDVKWTTTMDGSRHAGAPSITAKGMDFLADDGGLSAILGVVTVKLHEDTLKALLIERVEATNGDPTIKQLVVAKIRSMPAEALGSLTQRALNAGLEKMPDLVGWLHTLLGP